MPIQEEAEAKSVVGGIKHHTITVRLMEIIIATLIISAITSGVTMYTTISLFGERLANTNILVQDHEDQLNELTKVAASMQVIAARVQTNAAELQYRRERYDKIPQLENEIDRLKESIRVMDNHTDN